MHLVINGIGWQESENIAAKGKGSTSSSRSPQAVIQCSLKIKSAQMIKRENICCLLYGLCTDIITGNNLVYKCVSKYKCKVIHWVKQ